MMNHCVWYISKYAGIKKGTLITRHYYFSKYFVKNNYSVYLISSNSTPNHYKFSGLYEINNIEGFTSILINGIKVNFGFSIKRIYSWIQFEINLFRFILKKQILKPDIVIVSSLSLLTILNGLYLKKRYKAKLIFEVRDIWPLSIVEIGNISKFNIFILVLNFFEKLAYNKSDVIVGTMPNLKNHVYQITKKHLPVYYISMGVDEDELLNITDLPEDLKPIFTNDKFKIGYAGTIGSANQINQIIDAAFILKDNEKIHFYILGNGPKKQDYIDYVKSLHLNNITFLDAIPKESVVAFLRNCDVLVNPWKKSSIYNYGVSPNKWIDYMLSARPILVPYNGFRNIINEAKCGEFIDAENPFLLSKKIEEYSLKNKEELLETGLNGYNYLLENLTYRKLSKDYINLFSIK